MTQLWQRCHSIQVSILDTCSASPFVGRPGSRHVDNSSRAKDHRKNIRDCAGGAGATFIES
ncbi:hypothetical protein SERLADRAFT_398272, partial [Serpula lacrymans var. lacrymans S7.9]